MRPIGLPGEKNRYYKYKQTYVGKGIHQRREGERWRWGWFQKGEFGGNPQPFVKREPKRHLKISQEVWVKWKDWWGVYTKEYDFILGHCRLFRTQEGKRFDKTETEKL